MSTQTITVNKPTIQAVAVAQQVVIGGGGGGGTAWVYEDVTANTTLTASAMAGVDTDTLAITVTLPATPSADDEIWVKDKTGNAAANNITVARNGSTIVGAAADLTINVNYASVFLKYSGTTWEVVS